MKSIETAPGSFSVLEKHADVQTAVMRLSRGQASGPLDNEHAESTQVLLVLTGRVQAQIGERHFTMSSGDSVIVPKTAPHRFVGESDEPAVTFNVYSPPAY